MRKLGGFFCGLIAATLALQFLESNAFAVDTMADWVGRNNAPGPTYHFDSQVLNSTNTASPTEDNFVVISPTSIGGQKQAKVNFNFDPNNRINEDPLEAVNVNYEHIYLADRELEGGARTFANAFHMEGTLQFDMPAAGAAGETGAEPNFCFCWYDPTDTRHRVGLGLSNTTTLPLTAAPNALRADLFYASSAGNGFVFATKDGTASEVDGNSLIPDGTYSFVFDYVPATDVNSTDTTGSSMSATITDGTTTWSRTLAPLPNAPWFFDAFSLDKFGVIIRSTSGALRNGVFDFEISNLSYTGGTALPEVSGDHNEDGFVDAADYVAWRKTDGTQGGYDAFYEQFGETISGSGGSGGVPEPSSLILCLVGAVALTFSGRNSRHR